MILIKYKRKVDLKPYFYFALEQYVLNNLLKKDEIFFFLWKIKGVVVGKNQVIENEVNLDFVKKNNILIFRRLTGGGCVYNDPQTPIFSIVTKKKDPNFSFQKYLKKIIEAFECLGVNLNFSGRNDILLDNKKVSGNAFMQNANGMVMHGTLLYDCDIDTMVRCITPNDEKLVSKGIQSVSSRITNLKPNLKGITQEELMFFLEKYLTNQAYNLNNEEILKIENMSQKYSSKEWIFFEHPSYSKILKKRFDWGYLEILLSLHKGKIKKISLFGDFFHKEDNLENFLVKFQDIFYDYKDLEKILIQNNIGDYILNATNEDFLTLLKTGIIHS